MKGWPCAFCEYGMLYYLQYSSILYKIHFLRFCKSHNFTLCYLITLTSNIKTGACQNIPSAAMAHQVVPWLLLGTVESVQCYAQRCGTEHRVGALGQSSPIQCPVQGAGRYPQLRVNSAHHSETGADGKCWVLGGDHSQVWGSEK